MKQYLCLHGISKQYCLKCRKNDICEHGKKNITAKIVKDLEFVIMENVKNVV